MYTCINGWTRERMKAAIRAGNNGTRALGLGGCAYLATDGNKCVVGCFIPDGHPGQWVDGTAFALLKEYPALGALMPLPTDALQQLQRYGHDLVSPNVDVRDVACEWIDENVQDAT